MERQEGFRISHNKDSDTKPIYFHSHDFYEIYFFVEGSVTYYIENESYELSSGDVLVIPPGKLHRPVFEGEKVYDRYVLWIYASCTAQQEGIRRFLEQIDRLAAEKNTRRLSYGGRDRKRVAELFGRLQASYASGEELREYVSEGCMLLLLDEVRRALEKTERVSEEEGGLARQVIAYINGHVADAPSLEELAAEFYVSKYYLLHQFKEYARTTVHQYILMKKINLAKDLLEQGDAPQQVSEKCGFSTYSNFYKVFTAQTGTSPRRYRVAQSKTQR